jgi:sec-independent protein translocase protein TatA
MTLRRHYVLVLKQASKVEWFIAELFCVPEIFFCAWFFKEAITLPNMSAGEIILILFIYLLFFGAKGIPSIAQTLGKAMYQFRNAAKDVQSEILQSANEIKKEVRLDQMDIDETPKQRKPTPPPPTTDNGIDEQ